MMGFFFFFNDTATTEIYTLSLHDALPIYLEPKVGRVARLSVPPPDWRDMACRVALDRKSTRLNSSHLVISYAVFCLKKKTKRHPVSGAAPPRTPRRRSPARLAF